MRKCSLCKYERELSEFYTDRSKSGYRYICKPCDKLRITNIQQALKRKCVEYKGGECASCGYKNYYGSMHFHHLDPDQKDFTISSKKGSDWEAIKAELDKCLLLCSNCHGEVHAQLRIKDLCGIYTKPVLVDGFYYPSTAISFEEPKSIDIDALEPSLPLS